MQQESSGVSDHFPPSDCTICGRCCFSKEPDYIRVFAVDEARMSASTITFTEQRDGIRVMRFAEGRCVALRFDAADRIICTIYDERPDVCRALERGSGQCRGDVEGKGDVATAFIAASRLRRRGLNPP
jgi:uncharacterized protein